MSSSFPIENALKQCDALSVITNIIIIIIIIILIIITIIIIIIIIIRYV